MENASTSPLNPPGPSDDDIRAYAYELYQQSNGAAGHDLDHWREATACLKANIPAHRSGTRLADYLNGPKGDPLSLLSLEAKILAS